MTLKSGLKKHKAQFYAVRIAEHQISKDHADSGQAITVVATMVMHPKPIQAKTRKTATRTGRPQSSRL